MQNPLTQVVEWIADALIEKITEPIDKINKRLDKLESLHTQDAAALEADLSMMDDRICFLIGVCRRRGYTTTDERRRVTRLHDAYSFSSPCSSRCRRRKITSEEKELNR